MRPRSIPRAWFGHVVLSLLHGALAAVFGVGACEFFSDFADAGDDLQERLVTAGIGTVFAVLFVLSALAFCRRVDVLIRRARLELSPAGVAVRGYVLGWRALFRPRFRWFERMVPWPEFRGCRAERGTVYELIPVKQSLILESTGTPFELTWGMFRGSITRLHQEILDYWQLEILKPAQDDARVPELLQRIFARPYRYAGPRLGRTEVAGTILVVPVVGAAYCLQVRDLGLARALAYAAALLAVGLTAGVLLLRRWIAATRFIQLGADGLAVGPDERRARLIPWSDLRFARVHAVAGSPPSSLTKLELRLRNGEAVFIRACPEATRLAGLIDPPAEAVRSAWRSIAAGQDARSAAREAGIPISE